MKYWRDYLSGAIIGLGFCIILGVPMFLIGVLCAIAVGCLKP
jgi:hypothetical protein